MDDRNLSPASSSSRTPVEKQHCRRLDRRRAIEEDGSDPVACTGKSCQSCTAGVIADCVAMCCCPCAVVNIITLAFLKLPWAIACKYLGDRRKKMRRRRRNRGILEERRCCRGDTDGILENGRVEDGISDTVSPPAAGARVCEEVLNDIFNPAEFTAEEVWLELYEVGHMGFGRVSFTGLPFHRKGN